jgi:hypothetical protein
MRDALMPGTGCMVQPLKHESTNKILLCFCELVVLSPCAYAPGHEPVTLDVIHDIYELPFVRRDATRVLALVGYKCLKEKGLFGAPVDGFTGTGIDGS